MKFEVVNGHELLPLDLVRFLYHIGERMQGLPTAAQIVSEWILPTAVYRVYVPQFSVISVQWRVHWITQKPLVERVGGRGKIALIRQFAKVEEQLA